MPLREALSVQQFESVVLDEYPFVVNPNVALGVVKSHQRLPNKVSVPDVSFAAAETNKIIHPDRNPYQMASATSFSERVAMSKFAHVQPVIDEEMAEAIELSLSYTETILRPYVSSAFVNYNRVSLELHLNKHATYPWSLWHKTKASALATTQFEDFFARYIESCLQGKPFLSFFAVLMKTELRKKSKMADGLVRSIMSAPLHNIILANMCNLLFNVMFYASSSKHFGCIATSVVRGGLQHMYSNLGPTRECYELDTHSHESTMYMYWHFWCARLRIRLYKGTDTSRVLYTLFEYCVVLGQCVGYAVLHDGVVLPWLGWQTSGNSDTIVNNTLTTYGRSLSVFFYCYRKKFGAFPTLDETRHLFKAIVVGDDMNMKLSSVHILDFLRVLYAKLGVSAKLENTTNEEPRFAGELSFLSHHPRETELGLVASLDTEKMNASLYYSDSDNPNVLDLLSSFIGIWRSSYPNTEVRRSCEVLINTLISEYSLVLQGSPEWHAVVSAYGTRDDLNELWSL